MRIMKKEISLLIVLCLFFTLLFPAPVFAEGGPTLRASFVNTGGTITYGGNPIPVWKMVVGTSGPSGVEVLSSVFSIDTNVIKPVEMAEDESGYVFSNYHIQVKQSHNRHLSLREPRQFIA